jgi:hypothetical protein
VGGLTKEGVEIWGRTSIGVPAREGALDATESRYGGSKKCGAIVKEDSAPSQACSES